MLRLTNNPANANSASSGGVNRNSNTNNVLQNALNINNNNGGIKRKSNNVNTILINRRTGAAINTAEKPHVSTHVDPNANINNKEEKITTDNNNNNIVNSTTSRNDSSRNTNTSSVYSSLRKDRSYAEVHDNGQGTLTSVNGNVTNTVFMSNGAMNDDNGVLANAEDNNMDYMNNNHYSKCQIHDGILGCIRRRILCEMIDSVAGMYKILICDNIAAQIISSVVRMHDLLDHGVTLVEDLFLTRQPIISSPALYLLCPEEASIRQVLQDWQCKLPYKSAHIFFIGRTPDRLIQQLASVPRLVSNTQTLKDLYIDFTVPESLLFHLNFPLDYNTLFPSTVGLSTLTTPNSNSNSVVALQIATRLMSVLHTMNCGVPLVRYQSSSSLAHSVARGLLDELARMAKDESAFQLFAHNPDRPLLLIVDRSFDPVAPLVHERSYQCLLDDLMPLVNNIYEQVYVGRKGEQGTRTSVLDENDMYWCQYRHKFFAICLEEFAKLMQELLRSNPSLAQGMQQSMNNTNNNNNNKRLEELGSAIRALPEFQERQAKLSMHIDICSKIMQKYSSQRLAEVCEIEQDIVASRKTFKENYENVRRLVSDETLTSNVRLRLLLILFTVCDSRKIHELSQVKRLELINEGKLASEVEKMSNLPRFIPQSGMLKYRESEMIGRSSPDSYANRSTSSSTKRHDRNKFSTTSNNENNDNNESVVKSDKKFTLKSLRRGIDLTSSAKNSINNVLPHNTDGLDDTKNNIDTLNSKNKRTNADSNNIDGIKDNDADNENNNKKGGMRKRDPFRNQAYLILNAACHNILSSSDFPTLNEAMCENDINVRNATGKRTLRMGLARLHDIAGKRNATNKTNNFYNSGNNNNNNNDNNTVMKMSSSSTANTNTSEFSVNRHATLDLHHEGNYSLTATPKIILFVIGGVTYGETRAAYEIAKKNGRECIIGSTSLLRPESFVAQLQAMHEVKKYIDKLYTK